MFSCATRKDRLKLMPDESIKIILLRKVAGRRSEWEGKRGVDCCAANIMRLSRQASNKVSQICKPKRERKGKERREIKSILACDACVPVDGVGSEAARKLRNNTWMSRSETRLPMPVTLSNSGVLCVGRSFPTQPSMLCYVPYYFGNS
jgi:hypothetical protein